MTGFTKITHYIMALLGKYVTYTNILYERNISRPICNAYTKLVGNAIIDVTEHDLVTFKSKKLVKINTLDVFIAWLRGVPLDIKPIVKLDENCNKIYQITYYKNSKSHRAIVKNKEEFDIHASHGNHSKSRYLYASFGKVSLDNMLCNADMIGTFTVKDICCIASILMVNRRWEILKYVLHKGACITVMDDISFEEQVFKDLDILSSKHE